MQDQSNQEAELQPMWADDAPRGGKAVLTRILKEKSTVPLFFGQTLIQSLRDLGYNSTTAALCEHVDNAIQAGASEIRVYFHQRGKRGGYKTSALVLDNGKGMAPNVLKFSTAFGGSMVFGSRTNIGRFGMGMKAAALSMSPVMDLYSWQELGVFYNMTLDVEAIGRERANLIELPDPNLLDALPESIVEILTPPLSFPDRDEQHLLAETSDDLRECLGASGTIVCMPECDRLTSARARTLSEQSVKEMSRVYRRFLAKGLKLYVNNRLVEPFDPTYSMPTARHTNIAGITEKQSRLVLSKVIHIWRNEQGLKNNDADEESKVPVTVRLFMLPIEDWSSLPFKVRKNDLHLYDDTTVSVLRNDREVFIGTVPAIAKRHSEANWFRIQVDFTGELDEAFGVAANKQGIRPKEYVWREISNEMDAEISAVREQIKRFQSAQTVARQGSRQSAGELKADEAEGLQPKRIIEPPAPTTPEEQAQLDTNLRTLAMVLKRAKETDEEAFDRIKESKHIIHFKPDEYWPFYHVDQRFGKIILTINTTHPFYDQLYEPLSQAAQAAAADPNGDKREADGAEPFQAAQNALIALQLLLLSLARTQTCMATQNPDLQLRFDQFRKEWSDAYRTQLLAP